MTSKRPRDYSSDELTLHYYADDSVRNATGRRCTRMTAKRAASVSTRVTSSCSSFAHNRTVIRWRLTLRRDGGDYEGRPDERKLEIVIHNWSAPANNCSFQWQDDSAYGSQPSPQHADGARRLGSLEHDARDQPDAPTAGKAGRLPGLHAPVSATRTRPTSRGARSKRTASASSRILPTTRLRAFAKSG